MSASRRASLALLVAVIGGSIVGGNAVGRAAPVEPVPVPVSVARSLARAERLSLDLRTRRLDGAERTALQSRFASTPEPMVWSDTVDQWLGDTFYRKLARTWFLEPSSQDAASFFVLGAMTRTRDESTGEIVYRLNAAKPLCAARARVSPWWDARRTVTVCADDYRPDHAFDDVGWCGGTPEASVPWPRRPGCGCGPGLLACLPPEEDMPNMTSRLRADVEAEVVETTVDILKRHRPLDEVYTTSRTWQTGLVELLYARREVLAATFGKPWDATRERRVNELLRAVDVGAPGHWVMRRGVYESSGLMTTTAWGQALLPTYRAQMLIVLYLSTCAVFKGVNVDAASIVAAVKDDHANLRPFRVQDSPMRNQEGCSGCHAPLDAGAGFLGGMTTPLFGSRPTTDVADGKLYIKGAADLRGEGVGFAALSSLLVKQPDFETCAVSRAYTTLVGHSPTFWQPERELIDRFTIGFRASHHDFGALARDIVTSRAYRDAVDL